MKIVLIMVSSLDGIIAKNTMHNSFEWTSKEDKAHFKSLTKDIGVLLMGGNTFKASGRKSYTDRVAYVLTNNPNKYEFGKNIYPISGSPESVVKHISKEGYSKVALVGGAQVNSEFLQAGLIDEIYLTIEPIVFGEGIHIFENLEQSANLTLISSRKLNLKGTLLLHYSVDKSI